MKDMKLYKLPLKLNLRSLKKELHFSSLLPSLKFECSLGMFIVRFEFILKHSTDACYNISPLRRL